MALMTGNKDETPSHPHQRNDQDHVHDRDADQGTVLDRIKMPPMSGEEALRRFAEGQGVQTGLAKETTSGELDRLHPVMKLVALFGTLCLIVAVLLGVLYLFAA